MAARFFSRNSKGTEITLTLIRITLGLFLIVHGAEVFDETKMKEYAGWMPKIMKFSPSFIAYAGKVAELTAGVMFVFGLLTRLASLFVIITFAFISFKLGEGRIWMEEQHPFMFCMFGLLFLFAGAGIWSIDRLMWRKQGGSR